MKNLIQILFALLIIFGNSAAAQDLRSRLENILVKHYPDPTAPGAVLSVSKDHQQTIVKVGNSSLSSIKEIGPNTAFRMASVSKQFTGNAIFRLVQEGKLDLQQHISRFFPKLKGEVGSITVLQLLNHSSGIADYEDLMDDNWKHQLQDADVLSIIEPHAELYFKSGTQFRYSNTGYCLLALIVEQVSQSSYPDFMKKSFFIPLNMASTQVKTKDSVIKDRAFGYHPEANSYKFADQSLTSATMGDGGVYTTAMDYPKWLGLIQTQLKDTEKLPKYLDSSYQIPVNTAIQYSFGWFIGKDQHGETVLFHSGESTGFHNIVLFYPNSGTAISVFSNRDDLIIADLFEDIMQELGIQIPGCQGQKLFSWLAKVYAHEL